MKQTREYLKLEFKIDDIDFIKEMVTVGENIFPIHWICSYIHLSLFRSRYQGGEIKKPDYNICDICWMAKTLKIKERMSSDGNTESKAKQSNAKPENSCNQEIINIKRKTANTQKATSIKWCLIMETYIMTRSNNYTLEKRLQYHFNRSKWPVLQKKEYNPKLNWFVLILLSLKIHWIIKKNTIPHYNYEIY